MRGFHSWSEDTALRAADLGAASRRCGSAQYVPNVFTPIDPFTLGAKASVQRPRWSFENGLSPAVNVSASARMRAAFARE